MPPPLQTPLVFLPARSPFPDMISIQSRYVVVGKRNRNARERQGSSTYVQGVTTGRMPTSMPKPLPQIPITDEYCILVYKAKVIRPNFLPPWG